MTKERPKVNSAGQKELDKAQEQFETFDQNVKQLTLDRMNAAPKKEVEGAKISQREIEKSKEVYLKPNRSIGAKETFDEKYREDWNYAKEYVQFIAYNKEVRGESIECWTRPFRGVPAEFWQVPVNKPVWGPRYLAEQIKSCCYHKMAMDKTITTGSDGHGQYFGSMVVDETIQRLDAQPVAAKKSIFMGANNF